MATLKQVVVPSAPKPREPIKADWGKAVCEALAALKERTEQIAPSGGPGSRTTSTPGGTTTSIRQLGRPFTEHPFKVRFDLEAAQVIVGRGLAGFHFGYPIGEQSFGITSGKIYHILMVLKDQWSGGGDVRFVCETKDDMVSPTSYSPGWDPVAGTDAEFWYDTDGRPTGFGELEYLLPVAVVKTDTRDGKLVGEVLEQYLRSDIVVASPGQFISTATGALGANILVAMRDDDNRLYVPPPPPP